MEIGKPIPPLVLALRDLHARTTAEVRIHLSRWMIEKDPDQAAVRVFRHYGMHRTKDRNGLLVYLNLRKRQFALVGDFGLQDRAGEAFWRDCSTKLSAALRSSPLDTALVQFIGYLAERLEALFPSQPHEP